MLRPQLLVVLLVISGAVRGQSTGEVLSPRRFTEGFEGKRPRWKQEDADAAIRLIGHDISQRARHGGEQSEHFAFTGQGPGSALYYSYPLPKIPLAEAMEVVLYVRCNQPGVQLLAQVSLPTDTDPGTGAASFVRVAGQISDAPDRWQRLELTDLATGVERQVRLLRLQTGRPINTEGAFLERIIVNLYCGGGETEVFLDDLSISPVPVDVAEGIRSQEALDSEPASSDAGLPELPRSDNDTMPVVLQAGRLTRDGRDWFPTILKAPGADLSQAIPFGFDAVALAVDTPASTVQQCLEMGAAIVPDLGSLSTPDERASRDAVIEAVRQFAALQAVAFWDLGEELGKPNDPKAREEQFQWVQGVMEGIRGETASGPGSLVTGVLEGDATRYALPGQSLDLIGVAPCFWGAERNPADLLALLQQRRNSTALWNVGIPYWAWIDLAPPPSVRLSTWGIDAPPAWGSARVSPEQVRLASYLALMAGCRGLGYRGDAELTRETGRAVLYEMGLLNAEFDLIEGLLARSSDPIVPLETYPPDPRNLHLLGNADAQSDFGRLSESIPKEFPAHPSIKGAAISSSDGRARLVFLADLQAGAQWQPGQMAFNDLKVVVPGAPAASQALEIRLGGGRWLDRERIPGGVRFSLPEFGVATMVLLTSDIALGQRVQREIARIRPRAVDLALKQARIDLEATRDLNGRLALQGHFARDSSDLLALAARSLDSAEQARAREDYELAWDEARRVGRPLRLLKRAHWDQAVGRLQAASSIAVNRERARESQSAGGPPIPVLAPVVASPPLVTFNTLPQHYTWCQWIEKGRFGENLLPGPGLDEMSGEGMAAAGWVDARYRDSKARGSVRLIDAGQPGDQGRGKILRLSVEPTVSGGIDTAPVLLDQPAAAIQTPALAVKAQQFLRISALVKMPRKLPLGSGGLIIRDSIGGEVLQFRVTEAIPDWRLVTLFRRVPSDGDLTVIVGLAGFGEIFVDDLKIQRLEELAGAETLARQPSPSPSPVPAPSLSPGRSAQPSREAAAPRPLPR